jgi:hypothetical protein
MTIGALRVPVLEFSPQKFLIGQGFILTLIEPMEYCLFKFPGMEGTDDELEET